MTNIVDGQNIAGDIAARLRAALLAVETKPVMGIVIVSESPVTQSYVTKKRLFAQSIGVPFVEKYLPENITQHELEQQVRDFAGQVDGLVVQLPLPKHLDTDQVLSLIDEAQDVDGLNPGAVSRVTGPVAGAVMEIIDVHGIDMSDKKIVVIGQGKLVGKPVMTAMHARDLHPQVVVLGTDERESKQLIAEADVLVAGAGVAGMVTPDMVKSGVVLIDAGTTASRGTVRGDIDPGCADKAALISLTPGGVGPITVAKLFENLLTLRDLL